MKMIRIRRRDFSIPIQIASGQPNVVIVERPTILTLDIEDTHFNFDRSIVLPDIARVDGSVPILTDRHITGLGVIYAAYVHAQRHPEQKALIVGHADKEGSNRYNQKLSEKRAKNAYLLLSGQRDEWRSNCDKEAHVDDYQAILKWQAEAMGWDCDPGEITGETNSETEAAVGHFQLAYNTFWQEAQDRGLDMPYAGKIDVDEDIGPQTWGAFYDVYMRALMLLMKVDAYADVKKAQTKFQVFDDLGPAIGCGEHIPFDPKLREAFRTSEGFERPQRNPPDRRVEILFFDKEEKPDLVCHRKKNCDPTNCPLYKKREYIHRPIGVPKGLQIGEVNLQLGWKDAQETVRPLPEGTKITVTFGTGAQLKRMLVSQGRLQFVAPRADDEFLLGIELGERCYLVLSKDEEGNEISEFLTRDDALAKFDEGARFFRVPEKLGTAHARWSVPSGVGFEFGLFTDFKLRKTQIGERDAPVALTLTPVWQHFRFDYFDRWDAKRKAVPQPRPRQEGTDPLVLQGFREDGGHKDGPQGPPVAEAVWDVEADGGLLHCLPWIVEDWKRPVPDAKCLTRFATTKDTFVRAGDEAPTLVTVPDGHALRDEVSKAGVARVRYYDLPEEWWATGYFVRLGADDKQKFEALKKQSTHTEPYIVDLDDLVLCTVRGTINPFEDPGASLNEEPTKNLVWDDGDENRFTIWDHELKPHKPHSKEAYFTDVSQLRPAPDASLILDHPGSTRLITIGMRIFDVFDRRTQRHPAHSSVPIGARMAVDANEPVQYKPFFAFEETYSSPRFTKNGKKGTVGHCPTMVLRCCGRDGDKEVFRFAQYAPVFFDFAPTNPSRGSAITPTPSATAQLEHIRKCLIGSAKRWNGGDGFSQPVEFEVGPQDKAIARGSYHALLVRGTVNTQHYHVQIVKEARAFMARKAVWSLPDMALKKFGRFTAAHEFGHAFGHPDEYVETARNASLFQNGIVDDYRSPGCPYEYDRPGMMSNNVRPRAHSWWHLALWMIDKDMFGGEKNVAVCKGEDYRYAADITKPDENRARFPVISKVNQKVGAAGLLDVFAYHVGGDGFNSGERGIMPTTKDDPFDLIVMVRVKMAWNLSHADHKPYDGGKKLLNKLQGILHRSFNLKRKLAAVGTLGGKSVRARVIFSPRFISATFPTGSGKSRTGYLSGLRLKATTSVAYQTKVRALIKDHEIHGEFEARKDPSERGIKPPYLTPRLGSADTDKIEDDVIDIFGTLVGLKDPSTEKPDDFKPLLDLLAPRFAYSVVEFVK